MSLRLEGISKQADGELHIDSLDLELQPGTMNVLLGPTLAGKTSLMRIMAGLDRPDRGRILWQGTDVTGLPVQRRDVAMVFQQFINYPSMSVRENIASPLKLQRRPAAEVEQTVARVAELLRLTPYLERRPSELSGGQQQRCAIARALAKDTGLVLLDEPLANLDYKLREELRTEIPKLFAASGAIFVYATTEPEEALLLGGNTACLWEGRLTQFGPSSEVYRAPADEISARVFSDPPMNVATITKSGEEARFPGGRAIRLDEEARAMPDGDYRAGFRAHDLKVGKGGADQIAFTAKVVAVELTGSDTYLHVDAAGERWIGLIAGPRNFAVGERVELFLDPARLLYFGADGKLANPPRRLPVEA